MLSRDDLNDTICVVLGTRPGIVKLSPVVHELTRRHLNCALIHTGQHYSYDMDRQFFEELDLPEPAHKIPPSPPGALHGEQTARMLSGVERALVAERPRFVIVGGDANTNLAGALAARKLQLTVGHIEAGLRSYDWTMPEEHNRVMIDHISDVLFAPTPEACDHLRADNVRGHIVLTGNTIVDAVERMVRPERSSDLLRALGVDGPYAVVTVHREENVDMPERLELVVRSVEAIAALRDWMAIFPLHPRTRARLASAGLLDRLQSAPNLRVVAPLGYTAMLALIAGSCLVATDSGGLQEESCILRVPCVTLRDNTERPETIRVHANVVAGVSPVGVLAAVTEMLAAPIQWRNPFGDGRAAQRIVDVASGLPTDEWRADPILEMA